MDQSPDVVDRWNGEIVKSLAASGDVVLTSTVIAGRYAIRLVVRDSEGQLMAAQNGAVEIPY